MPPDREAAPAPHPGPGASTGGTLTFRHVPAEAPAINGVRHVLRSWLRALPLGDEIVTDVVSACYEAMANAVEHAYRDRGRGGTLDVAAEFRSAERRLTVAVSDRGRWREVPSASERGARGHGLPLIRLLAPESVVTAGPEGTRVTMSWPV